MTGEVVLSVRDLQTELPTMRGNLRAVDGVSFDLHRGEVLGLAGESGSGKSITALSIVRLLPRGGRVVAGQVLLDGEDLVLKTDRQMERIRGRKIAMVLQDPATSLNPVLTVGEQIAETIRHHQHGGGIRQRAVALLRRVRIPDPDYAYRSIPLQMSGGMRQRAVSAIAMASTPTILIADEPTSALDPTVQAQYLDLLRDLQRESGLSIILITHDLGVVAAICDTIAIMYAGRIVEYGPTRQVFRQAAHPYTEGLLRSVPRIEDDRHRLEAMPGQPPSPFDVLPGCTFTPRCPYAVAQCTQLYPPDVSVAPDHRASCWRVDR